MHITILSPYCLAPINHGSDITFIIDFDVADFREYKTNLLVAIVYRHRVMYDVITRVMITSLAMVRCSEVYNLLYIERIGHIGHIRYVTFIYYVLGYANIRYAVIAGTTLLERLWALFCYPTHCVRNADRFSTFSKICTNGVFRRAC